MRQEVRERAVQRSHGIMCAPVCAVAGSFMDLSQLLASSSSRKGAFDDLANQIGRDAYADVNGWHLFLRDMSVKPGGPKMSEVLAEQFGEQVLLARSPVLQCTFCALAVCILNCRHSWYVYAIDMCDCWRTRVHTLHAL